MASDRRVCWLCGEWDRLENLEADTWPKTHRTRYFHLSCQEEANYLWLDYLKQKEAAEPV